jgi:hypothetical protein
VVDWRQLLVVVKPATLVRWHRQEMRGKPRAPRTAVTSSAKTDGIPSFQHGFSAVFITSTGWRQSRRRFCAVVPPKTETPRSRAAGRSRHLPHCRSREDGGAVSRSKMSETHRHRRRRVRGRPRAQQSISPFSQFSVV